MWGAVCIISQPFFQECSVGVWREIQPNFSPGVLTALTNIDLLSGTGLFYHAMIWKGSKYGGFSAFPSSTNTCGQAMCMFCVAFHKFGWISCQSQISLTTLQLAFPPFLSPWWCTFICSLVSGSSICQDFFNFCEVFVIVFSLSTHVAITAAYSGMFVSRKAFLLEHVQRIKANSRG